MQNKVIKVIAVAVVSLILLVVASLVLLNTDGVQNWLMQRAVTMLQEKLQTKVRVDRVSVNLFRQHVSLEGLEIDDQQQRKMLQMEELSVGLDLWALLHNSINITRADVTGLQAHLYKPASPSDTAANYQFVIDAFKKPEKEPSEKKSSLTFDIRYVQLERTSVSYNGDHAELGRLVYRGEFESPESLEAESLKATYQGSQMQLGSLSCKGGFDRIDDLEIKDLKGNYKDYQVQLGSLTGSGSPDRIDDLEIKDLKGSFKDGQVQLASLTGRGSIIRKTALSGKHSITGRVDSLEIKDLKGSYKGSRVQLASLTGKGSPEKIEALEMKGLAGNYKGYQIALASLTGKGRYDSPQAVTARGLTTAFTRRTKKGPVATRLHVARLNLQTAGRKKTLTVDGLRYQTDNHKPRKNTGKPNRGFFDVGHFDITARLVARIDSVSKDTLSAALTTCQVTDRGSGLHFTNILMNIVANKRKAVLRNVRVRTPNTSLAFDRADVQLPNKKTGRTLNYKTTLISGRTLLKDISRPFAPVLRNFSIPLQLQCYMSGNADAMQFTGIRVGTLDNTLAIRATGSLSHLKDKHLFNAHFDVHSMVVQNPTAVNIINQFTVRKFMMKQFERLGQIAYQGSFDVLWRKEQFTGQLTTEAGPIDFRFALDENTKYVSGTVATNSFQLGQVMDMSKLGDIVCKAEFEFDFSKKRTKAIRQKHGGKLPIGHVEAQVDKGSYGIIKVHDVEASIISDGAVATGKVVDHTKHIDLICHFTFTDTDQMKNIKIKPGIKIH